MSFIIELLGGNAQWLIGGVLGLLALLGSYFKIRSDAKKEGVQQERAKQVAADTKARDVIHEKKEDVRAIPDTPEGKAEKIERLDRWIK